MTMRSFVADERAQGTAIANFFLALVIAAIVTWILSMAHDHLMPLMQAEANDPVANTAVTWSGEVLNNAPAVFVFTAVLSLITLSVYQRALGR